MVSKGFWPGTESPFSCRSFVIPAEAGIEETYKLDLRFHGDDSGKDYHSHVGATRVEDIPGSPDQARG